MKRKLHLSPIAFVLLCCALIASTSLASASRASSMRSAAPLFLTTVNIPPGSSMYIAPNNADPTFEATLANRMAYVGLLAPPYSLTITTNSAAANYWLIGGTDEIFIPDGWIVGTLHVVNPSTKQILNSYMSRAAYPTYDEQYVCRKLAQNGLLPDVHF